MHDAIAVPAAPAERRLLAGAYGSRWCRVALLVVGLATAPLIVLPIVREGGLSALDRDAILLVLVPWSFVASGFVAWDRRPENRIGALLVLLGLWWTAGRLMGPPTTSSPLVSTVGWLWRLAWTFLFVLILLLFPRGRLSLRSDKAIAAIVFFIAVPMQFLWLFFLPNETPRNVLTIYGSQRIADVIDVIQRVIYVAVALVLVGLLTRRWLRAAAPERRTLAPVLAGGVTVLVFGVYIVVDRFREVPAALGTALLVAYTAVPIALLVTMLRARLARSSVAELVVELTRHPAPSALRDALARALGDPSLALAFWLPEYERYADLDGRPVDVPEDEGPRATTLVDIDGAHVAAIVHDRSLQEEPELLDAVTAAAAISLENARLQSELKARLEELQGSRARILEAAQTERQRLERDLHDGAQQRLVALSIELGLLESRFEADPEARRRIEQVRLELRASLDQLREIAHGIHPALVTGHGLEVALDALAERSPLPVEVTVALERRLPERYEVAAYYLVAESLTNVAKHANATAAGVSVILSGDRLVVEVVDDGRGGATTDNGTGLRGLADRVEALGGRVRVWSPPGGGTRVRAEVPCA